MQKGKKRKGKLRDVLSRHFRFSTPNNVDPASSIFILPTVTSTLRELSTSGREKRKRGEKKQKRKEKTKKVTATSKM